MITGICIKSYQDEDDLDSFEEGEIEEEEIKIWEVGEEGPIRPGLYNPEFWKEKETENE